MDKLRTGALTAILVLMIYVVLNPGTTYAPVPRLTLFLLSSMVVAVFVGAEATTKFQMKLPGFVFVTTGTAALMVFVLWFLTNAIKPELQIAIYDVFDEGGNELNMDWDGALELREIPSGRPGFFMTKNNRIMITFPELVSEQRVRIRKTSTGVFYQGTISYAGARQIELKLGTDLKQ